MLIKSQSRLISKTFCHPRFYNNSGRLKILKFFSGPNGGTVAKESFPLERRFGRTTNSVLNDRSKIGDERFEHM